MAEGSDPDVQPPSFADWPASEATKWGNSWTTAGDQLEKLLRVLEEKREPYILPHRWARCVDRPWDAVARLRSTINRIDDWNRLFELVEKQGPWGPAGFGLWLLDYGSDLMTSSRVSKSTAWTMNYAELLRAMKEPLSAARSLHDGQGWQVKPLWGIGCEWWTTWAHYSSSELMQSLTVRSAQAAPKFCLRDPIYRNCYAAQSISGEERDGLSGKDDDEPTKAEARR